MKKKPMPKKSNRRSLALAILALVALNIGWAALSHAEPVAGQVYQWTDPVRLSFGVGGGYTWHTGEEASLPTTRKEFEVGAFGAYNIVPNFSAAGYAVRGFENRTWRAGLGPRLTVWKSVDKQHGASVSLRYAWHAGPAEELPAFRHEWEVGAEYGFQFSPKVIIGATSAYGLDSHTSRSTVAARYRLL
jgi:hypothetical protein